MKATIEDGVENRGVAESFKGTFDLFLILQARRLFLLHSTEEYK